MQAYPQRLYHNTPGWVKDGALFHIRIRTASDPALALTEPNLATGLLAKAARHHELGMWWCELFLLMPDHLHALLVFPREPGMSETIRGWKRLMARSFGIRWQENYFDHRIRNDEEAAEKWKYILLNPIVKNLCAIEDDWPWWWSCLDVSYLKWRPAASALLVERVAPNPLVWPGGKENSDH